VNDHLKYASQNEGSVSCAEVGSLSLEYPAMATLLKKIPLAPENKYLDIAFTKQEITIIKLICNKKTNPEIADELNISVRTVEGHRYNISKKTNTNNTIELIEYALKNGLT
jgi:DNA-binding NarL/FixJ family response regulator